MLRGVEVPEGKGERVAEGEGLRKTERGAIRVAPEKVRFPGVAFVAAALDLAVAEEEVSRGRPRDVVEGEVGSLPVGGHDEGESVGLRLARPDGERDAVVERTNLLRPQHEDRVALAVRAARPVGGPLVDEVFARPPEVPEPDVIEIGKEGGLGGRVNGSVVHRFTFRVFTEVGFEVPGGGFHCRWSHCWLSPIRMLPDSSIVWDRGDDVKERAKEGPQPGTGVGEDFSAPLGGLKGRMVPNDPRFFPAEIITE